MKRTTPKANKMNFFVVKTKEKSRFEFIQLFKVSLLKREREREEIYFS